MYLSGMFRITVAVLMVISAWLSPYAMLHHPVTIPDHLNPHLGVRVHFPMPPVRPIDPQIATLGAHVMREVEFGRAATAWLIKTDDNRVWLRSDYGKSSYPHVLPLNPQAVSWQGRWRLLSHHAEGPGLVSIVMQDKQVVGIVGLKNTYARVVAHRGQWLAFRVVRADSNTNPACRRDSGPVDVAQINRTTLWASRPGDLPVGSLAQLTLYGDPRYAMVLGGVEDYGKAPCP